jgi:hypothetical protein
MNTYLDEQSIKQLKNYLKEKFTPDVVATVRRLEKEMNVELSDTSFNIRVFNEYVARRLDNDLSPLGIKYRNNKWSVGQVAAEAFQEYRKKNFAKEYDIICNRYNVTEIWHYLNGVQGFCIKHYIEAIQIKDILYSDNLEAFCDSYSIKNADKKLVDLTNNICKYIDSIYFGKRGENNYAIYQEAIRVYMITGNKVAFHNILNRSDY